jgi:hypothetical protein
LGRAYSPLLFRLFLDSGMIGSSIINVLLNHPTRSALLYRQEGAVTHRAIRVLRTTIPLVLIGLMLLLPTGGDGGGPPGEEERRIAFARSTPAMSTIQGGGSDNPPGEEERLGPA